MYPKVCKIQPIRVVYKKPGNLKIWSPFKINIQKREGLSNLKSEFWFFSFQLWSIMWKKCCFSSLVFNSDHFYVFFFHKNAHVTFVEKLQLKMKFSKFYNSYLIKTQLLRVPLWFGHFHLCMEGHLDLHLLFLFLPSRTTSDSIS